MALCPDAGRFHDPYYGTNVVVRLFGTGRGGEAIVEPPQVPRALASSVGRVAGAGLDGRGGGADRRHTAFMSCSFLKWDYLKWNIE